MTGVCRNWLALASVPLVLGVTACGATKTVTVVHIDTATVVQTTTVTHTVTVTHKQVAAAASANTGQGVDTEALSNSFEQALQRALGTSDTIASGYGQSCSANVNPGSYDCFATGNGTNQYDYSVTAANGRWTGTVNAANQTNPEPSSLSGTY